MFFLCFYLFYCYYIGIIHLLAYHLEQCSVFTRNVLFFGNLWQSAYYYYAQFQQLVSVTAKFAYSCLMHYHLIEAVSILMFILILAVRLINVLGLA